jgi:4-amino-4-deoxy-L-arabinose transferase-like glycosyltransferase
LPFFIALIALAIRLAVIPFVIGETLDPDRDHWNFGWEEGRIARSIAAGEGFSSPLFGNTGPTAWTTPVYPGLLAGIFRLFGSYSRASAWIILALNAVFSALTCVPVYFVAARCFGPKAAAWAAWLWAFFPYAIYLASSFVWGYCLDALIMALILWATLEIEERSDPAVWSAYGLIWAFAALTNPVILSTLPPLLAWVLWRRNKRRLSLGFSRVAVAMLFFTIAVAPWFLRNYKTFGHVVPFRGTFWMIFWESNTGDTSDLYPDWTNPAHNDGEMQQYRMMGEAAYVLEKRRLSLEFLRGNPRLYLWLTMKRIIFTWTGFWSLRSDYLAREPFALANIAMCTALSLLMFLGMRCGLRTGSSNTVPLALVLVCYPVVYYLTHPGIEYRHPVDPVVVAFAGMFLSTTPVARKGWARAFMRSPVTIDTKGDQVV